MKQEAASDLLGLPSKKARTADFSTIVKRSHSITEHTIDMMSTNKKRPKAKHFNDGIHGLIIMPPAAVLIMDTPQFQRLRDLKQVGVCHLVYPSATHTRFQHSLGVAHLAFKFAEKLAKNNPEYNITEKDVLCVMIAGLCHDLGHGPFSHFWEGFVAKANPDLDWHHEDSSMRNLDFLIEDNDLKPLLKELGGITDEDIIFIKEAIGGPLDEKTGLPLRNWKDQDDGEWAYKGRPKEKAFLYEIVANKISGIDVDKWDYLQRDRTNMNINTNFQYERYIEYCKIMEFNGRPRICLRDKEHELVWEMFEDRARLHQKGYQHRVVKTLDRMMMDIMLLADKHIKVRGSNGQRYSLSEACRDVVAFQRLNDGIFNRIMDSEDEHPDMLKAIELCRRILKRDFYQNLGTVHATDTQNCFRNCKTCEDDKKYQHEYRGQPKEKLENDLRNFVRQQDESLNAEDFVVVLSKASMGMGNSNPIHKVPFYDREGKVTGVNEDLSRFFHFEIFYILFRSMDIEACLKALNVTKLFLDNNNING